MLRRSVSRCRRQYAEGAASPSFKAETKQKRPTAPVNTPLNASFPQLIPACTAGVGWGGIIELSISNGSVPCHKSSSAVLKKERSKAGCRRWSASEASTSWQR